MNIQDSPTKVIDPKQRKAVERAVRKEQSKIVSLELDGVHLDSSVRSMQELFRIPLTTWWPMHSPDCFHSQRKSWD